MIRMFFFLLGFGLSVLGFTYVIMYLNLFSMDYTLKEYLLFIITRKECISGLIGFIMLTLTIFIKGESNNDIHI